MAALKKAELKTILKQLGGTAAAPASPQGRGAPDGLLLVMMCDPPLGMRERFRFRLFSIESSATTTLAPLVVECIATTTTATACTTCY